MTPDAWAIIGTFLAGILCGLLAWAIKVAYSGGKVQGSVEEAVKQLTAEIGRLRAWLEKVAEGDTPAGAEMQGRIGTAETNIARHEDILNQHGRVLGRLAAAHQQHHGEQVL